MKPRLKRIRITVTAEHIRDGFRGSSSGCPVARAFKERMACLNIIVGGGFAQPFDDWRTKFATYNIPPDVRYKILRYDLGDPMEPFSFIATLDAFQPIQPIG